MPTAEDKERAKKGIKARQDAIATLIANHQAEFDALVIKNRTELGLPIKPQGPTREQLEERIKREEAKLAKWRQQLSQVA